MRRRALIGALAFAGLAAAGERPSLSQLYGEHRWIDLREALKDQAPPALYKGAVAFAFNDTKAAEEYLNQAIKLAPNSNDAKDAHDDGPVQGGVFQPRPRGAPRKIEQDFLVERGAGVLHLGFSADKRLN